MRTCSITTRLTAKDASAASMAGGAVDKAGVNGPASPPNQPLQQLRNRQAAAAPASRAATWTQSSTVPGGWVRLCPSTSTPVVNSGTPIVTRARPLISPRTSKFPRTLPLLISDMVLAEVLNLASDNVSIFADGYAVWLWRQGRRVSREWKAAIESVAHSWLDSMDIILNRDTPAMAEFKLHCIGPQLRLAYREDDDGYASFYLPYDNGDLSDVVQTAMRSRSFSLWAGQRRYTPAPSDLPYYFLTTAQAPWEVKRAHPGLVLRLLWIACVAAICHPQAKTCKGFSTRPIKSIRRFRRAVSPSQSVTSLDSVTSSDSITSFASVGSFHSAKSFDSVEDFLRKHGHSE